MQTTKLAAAATLALGLAATGTAHAWVQLCNGTSVTLQATYEWYNQSCSAEDGSVWEKRGWWILAPGQCKIVYGSAIPSRYSYYYAEGAGKVYAGPFFDCTPSSVFDLCDNSCTSNARSLGWRQLDTGSSSNYTLTFNP